MTVLRLADGSLLLHSPVAMTAEPRAYRPMSEGGMGCATGVPLALRLAVTAIDPKRPRGAFAPEAVVDPSLFFDQLARLCAPPRAGRGELLLVSRSWEPRDVRAALRTMSPARESSGG